MILTLMTVKDIRKIDNWCLIFWRRVKHQRSIKEILAVNFLGY